MSKRLDITITEPLASWKEPTSRLYCLEHPNIRLLVKWDGLVIEEELYCPICLNTFKRKVLVEKSPKIISDISDIEYFTQILIRSLGIPPRYLDI